MNDIADEPSLESNEPSSPRRWLHRGGWIAGVGMLLFYGWRGEPDNAFCFALSFLFAYLVTSQR